MLTWAIAWVYIRTNDLEPPALLFAMFLDIVLVGIIALAITG